MSRFAVSAQWASWMFGHPITFSVTLFLTIVWFLSGFLLGFDDTWQLYINTSTTVVTLFVVILVQNTQNRDVAEIKAMLREMVEDLPDVDDSRIAERLDEDLPR